MLKLMIRYKINVAELFRAKSPSFARFKEGDLPLLNFSNLTCMHLISSLSISFQKSDYNENSFYIVFVLKPRDFDCQGIETIQAAGFQRIKHLEIRVHGTISGKIHVCLSVCLSGIETIQAAGFQRIKHLEIRVHGTISGKIHVCLSVCLEVRPYRLLDSRGLNI